MCGPAWGGTRIFEVQIACQASGMGRGYDEVGTKVRPDFEDIGLLPETCSVYDGFGRRARPYRHLLGIVK
jgi:hypothetical protein